MKRLMGYLLAACVAVASAAATDVPQREYRVTIGKDGVLRRSDTGAEVSYYGTNYTLPFAHAYRAAGYLGRDRKREIDRDVQHFARLGLNAFRLHLWEAELADSVGNLLDNDHLDLLDYLVAALERRGIDVILTAQTNFGNGYPERDHDTGAFTYDFEKCAIHSDPVAQDAQERYLRQLVQHVNPYTGRSYGADRAVIAMEINNEPCHRDSAEPVREYIDRMARAVREAGFRKPVLYNASHNPEVTDAYYKSSVEGTTFQWYPTGLVSGRTRRGNFLPYVQRYDIPWRDTMPGFGEKARIVYEFDPADILYTYMYPATARAFRAAGFQWITQFAYDPTFMAAYNTEYPTHFLNLAYTPGKALGMMIAAEVARTIPRGTHGSLSPTDTVFGPFTVSYRRDLSLMNSPQKYIHTNSTDAEPAEPDSLRLVAGVGTSPLVDYGGSGAYFLDRIAPGVWRLEVWPDVLLTSDPFAPASLTKRVGEITYRRRPISLRLPGLGENFAWRSLGGSGLRGEADGSRISVDPGVYLLAADESDPAFMSPPANIGAIGIDEFEAPEKEDRPISVAHLPRRFARAGAPVRVEVRTAGANPDSIVVFPSDISFWRADNKLYPLRRESPGLYAAGIPTSPDAAEFSYNIVVYSGGKARTYPQGAEGAPLDWDYLPSPRYSVRLLAEGAPVELISPAPGSNDLEVAPAAEGEVYAWVDYVAPQFGQAQAYRVNLSEGCDAPVLIRRYVAADIADAAHASASAVLAARMCGADGTRVRLGVVDKDGITRMGEGEVSGGVVRIPLAELRPVDGWAIPAPFPTFISRSLPLSAELKASAAPTIPVSEIDFVQMELPAGLVRSGAEILSVWLE